MDGSRILAVYPSSVVVSSSSGACQLMMFGRRGRRRGLGPHPRRREQARPRSRQSSGRTQRRTERRRVRRGHREDNDTKFSIQRSLVDKALANQGSLMRAARVIPHEENGRVVGVKLYGIRRNSLLGRLGVRNGDMLRTINGFSMTSPDTALEAYSRLRTATSSRWR